MAETFETLLQTPGVLIERIVSHGETTPEDAPYEQAHDEWVMVVSGAARLRIEGQAEHALAAGDHLLIPGGARHWVTFTARDMATVWIAVHLPIA
jgi:cupin 2 domain-containing protein